MKLNLLPIAVCRTPAFAMDDTLPQVWEQLKEKILDSSPNFYQTIRHLQVKDLSALDPKLRFTLWKYFIRSKFRATPFGSFSAVTLVPIAKCPASLMIAHALDAHSFTDWSEKQALAKSQSQYLDDETLLHTNSACYGVGAKLRYLRTIDGKFELTTLDAFPEISTILTQCNTKSSLKQIQDEMKKTFNLKKNSTRDLISQMIAAQLLVPSSAPNIIGTDYFTRIGQPGSGNRQRYLISTRALKQGALNAQLLDHLPELLGFLKAHLPQEKHLDLENFKKAFAKKFGTKQVPLSIAMDPEIGVGYGELEHLVMHPAIECLKRHRSTTQVYDQLSYTPIHRFLLDQLILGDPIQLEKFCERPFAPAAELPNTFSLLVRPYQGKVVLESSGGATATALLGRFTLIGQEFEALGLQLAAIEQEANPQVLFFDIAYQAEQHIDNVNRRKSLYPAELPILTWTTSQEPLDFNDIQISLSGDELVLFSIKYKKRLVPRIASAYNYSRSDLSAYRFLCDLQSQGLHTNLSFSLPFHFPDLDRYPRVSFKNIILSPAKWRIPDEFISNAVRQGHLSAMARIKAWLKDKNIDFKFTLGSSDNTLCVDPFFDTDLEAMLQYCRLQTDRNVYLTEALIDVEGQPRDEHGKAYTAQFVVTYTHEREIYPKHEAAEDQPVPPERKDILMPGSEWVYFELYCYATRSESLLTEQIAQFLSASKKDILKWFFIHYDDPSNHIRLRILLKDPAKSYPLVQEFNLALQPLVESGELGDAAICTYHRELQRYGAFDIQQVETVFHLDSQLALSLIKKTNDIDCRYLTCLQVISSVYLSLLGTLDNQIAFVQQMAERFALECNTQAQQFTVLNRQFNRIKSQVLSHPYQAEKTIVNRLNKALKIVLNGSAREKKEKLVADLIHLHLNRRFPADQRLHETVVYHYLLRYLRAFRAQQG